MTRARTAQPEDLMLVLHAPTSVRAARNRIRHWLDGLTCPLPAAEDVELAVTRTVRRCAR